MAAGKFIVIEGPDLTGKSTIVTALSQWLDSKSVGNIITRHPGSTPVGAALRKLVKESRMDEIAIPPRTEGLIMAADNAAFIDLILKPSLEQGTWVIGDRNNFISGLVYQIKSGASLDDLDKIQDATATDSPKIDALFILTADEDTRRSRKQGRADSTPDRFEDRGQSYMDGVVKAYHHLLSEQSDRLMKFVKPTTTTPTPTPCVFYIDSSKPINAVLNSITDVIQNLLLC